MTAARTRPGMAGAAVATAASGLVVVIATVIVIVTVSILPLLTPWFTHAALDIAGSANFLGLDPGTAHALSDRSLAHLLDPGETFLFEGPDGRPFFDDAERAHLRDARTVLWLALAACAVCAATVVSALGRRTLVAREAVWRAVSIGGAVAAIGAVVVGAVGLAAFGALFTLFHEVAFPGGNWAFDPASQDLVRLYPMTFWQVAAGALASLVAVGGAVTWWAARGRARAARRQAT